MWASNLDFRHKPVIIAAVLGLVAIFPLLGLANGLLLFTADTQAARHNIAAPLGLVCRELTKTRNQHAWFPWYAEAGKQKLTPPKRTMLTPDYHFHAFADHSPLAGKAFTFETPRARCKSAKQGVTIRANIEFGLKPVKYSI